MKTQKYTTKLVNLNSAPANAKITPTNFIHRMNEPFDMLIFEFDDTNFARKNSSLPMVGNVKKWKCVMQKCISEFQFGISKCQCANYKFTKGQAENHNI